MKFKLFIFLKLHQSNLILKKQCDLLLLVSVQYYLANESAIFIQSFLMTNLIKMSFKITFNKVLYDQSKTI